MRYKTTAARVSDFRYLFAGSRVCLQRNLLALKRHPKCAGRICTLYLNNKRGAVLRQAQYDTRDGQHGTFLSKRLDDGKWSGV